MEENASPDLGNQAQPQQQDAQRDQERSHEPSSSSGNPSEGGADGEKPQVSQQPYIYRPESVETLLDHAAAPKLKYYERTAKDIELGMQNHEIKNLIRDVAFLTSKARYGDLVVYIGNNIGPWLPVTAKMFPTLQFLVFDGNPVKLTQIIDKGEDLFPPNIHVRPCWFNEVEAERLTKLKFPTYKGLNTLLISDTKNLVYDKENPGPVMRHVAKDMSDQELWVKALHPRSASIQFDMPYQGGKHYSFLAGEMHLQVQFLDARLFVPTYSADMYFGRAAFQPQDFNRGSASGRLQLIG